MKRERNCRNNNLELYKRLDEENNIEDTRYWGLFKFGKRVKYSFGEVKIDPKRFQRTTGFQFSEEQLKVINARRTHYFFPKKFYYDDYNCNVFLKEISDIKEYWINQFLPLIKEAIEKVNKPYKVSPGDYDNLQCGISGTGAAQAWANWTNMSKAREYREKCAVVLYSLYAEFFHFMASRIEAILVKVLNNNNALEDRFDRNIFYATAIGKDKKIQELEHFNSFDKIYCIWNFIKHNSASTYKTLNDRYPELVYQKEKYEQGDLALYFIQFSEELINNILYGCGEFFKEYCELVFNENYQEAQWNYTTYFSSIVSDEIETITNPLGLQWWDDID